MQNLFMFIQLRQLGSLASADLCNTADYLQNCRRRLLYDSAGWSVTLEPSRKTARAPGILAHEMTDF